MRTSTPLLLVLACGCSMRPEGEQQERERAEAFEFRIPLEKREPLQLAAEPTLDECVQYAYRSSPGLEVEYQKWRAAIELIPQVSSQPTTLEIGFDVLTGTGQPSLLDRTNLMLGTDATAMLTWPGKLAARGRAALETARAAGFHFDQMRGDLRAKVVSAYVDLAVVGELRVLQRQTVDLLATTVATLGTRAGTGDASPQDLVRARLQHSLAVNEGHTLEATERQRRAKLNALLGRTDPDATLVVRMPGPRPLAFEESRLLEHLRERNPELKEHGSEILAAKEALAAARMEWIPELSLATSLANATQTLGASLTLPFLRGAAIRGAIAQAEALVAEAEAYRRQMQSDMARDAIVELSLWRDSQRQLELFATTIVPAAEQANSLVRTSYGLGRASFLDLVEAQRAVVETKRMQLLMRAEHERSQAELERIAHSHDDGSGGEQQKR